MKTVKMTTALPELGNDPSPLALAQYIAAYLSNKTDGAVFGTWDDGESSGTWFYSRDTKATFCAPAVDEVIFRETDRLRFRSVVFRLGSLASETSGDLCGIMRIIPADCRVDPVPRRRYHVHASFAPEAGLWFKAAITNDAEGPSSQDAGVT